MTSPRKRPSSYHHAVRRVLVITLFLNLAVVAGKLIMGWLAGAISILSDAAHSGTDSINNVVGLFILRLATAEADEDHPYGHRKFESLAGFCIGGLLIITCFEVAKSALTRLFQASPVGVDISGLTLGGMLMTVFVNLFIYLYERREGERLGSHYLIADSLHTRSDILVTGALLIGLLFMRIGFAWLDPIFALLITGLIAHASWQVFQRTVPILVDAAPLASAQIQAIAMDVPGVKSVYSIRSRSDGEHTYIEFNLAVKPDDVYRAHLITEKIEQRLAEELGQCDVTIHVEPS